MANAVFQSARTDAISSDKAKDDVSFFFFWSMTNEMDNWISANARRRAARPTIGFDHGSSIGQNEIHQVFLTALART